MQLPDSRSSFIVDSRGSSSWLRSGPRHHRTSSNNMVASLKWGDPNIGLQNTIILILGTPEKVPLISGNPHINAIAGKRAMMMSLEDMGTDLVSFKFKWGEILRLFSGRVFLRCVGQGLCGDHCKACLKQRELAVHKPICLEWTVDSVHVMLYLLPLSCRLGTSGFIIDLLGSCYGLKQKHLHTKCKEP